MEVQQFFLDFGIPPSLVVIIIAAMPVIELRGAIPVAINVMGMPWAEALLLAIIGNMLPVPFILRFLNWATRYFSRYQLFHRFLEWLFARARARSSIIERYKRLGLTLFVATPIPVTGAWTGSIAAVLLEFPFRDGLKYIFIGVVMAGIIVTTLSLMGWWGAIIAIVLLFSIFSVRMINQNR